MITKQHTALTFMALGSICKTEEEFKELIPWVLLPDAIRAYVGPRQPSHFEELPNQTDTSWMVFPSAATLKMLSKETAPRIVDFHVADTPKCVIGEQTHIEVFDWFNSQHEFYHALRAHLRQDCILDAVLRDEMVEVKERFSDIFTIKHNGKKNQRAGA